MLIFGLSFSAPNCINALQPQCVDSCKWYVWWEYSNILLWIISDQNVLILVVSNMSNGNIGSFWHGKLCMMMWYSSKSLWIMMIFFWPNILSIYILPWCIVIWLSFTLWCKINLVSLLHWLQTAIDPYLKKITIPTYDRIFVGHYSCALVNVRNRMGRNTTSTWEEMGFCI